MSDKHISSQFDAELNSISSQVLEMGGLVESQLHQAVYALVHMSLESAFSRSAMIRSEQLPVLQHRQSKG